MVGTLKRVMIKYRTLKEIIYKNDSFNFVR